MAAHNFTNEELSEIEECFVALDKDGSGKLDKVEMGNFARALGLNPTNKELDKWYEQCDTDPNGLIDKEELIRLLSKCAVQNNESENLKKAFEVFDKDENGFLSSSELRHVLLNLGERLSDEEVDAMINEADQNGDGVVNYKEFCDMMAPPFGIFNK